MNLVLNITLVCHKRSHSSWHQPLKLFKWFEQKSFICNMKQASFNWLFWKANYSTVKLIISITCGVSWWYWPCYKNLWQWQKMPKTNNTIKVDFLWLKSRYWLSLGALTWLEMLRICLQISNELHDDVLCHR